MMIAGRYITIGKKPKLIRCDSHWACVGVKEKRVMLLRTLEIPVIAYGKDPAMAFNLWQARKP